MVIFCYIFALVILRFMAPSLVLYLGKMTGVTKKLRRKFERCFTFTGPRDERPVSSRLRRRRDDRRRQKEDRVRRRESRPREEEEQRRRRRDWRQLRKTAMRLKEESATLEKDVNQVLSLLQEENDANHVLSMLQEEQEDCKGHI